MLKFIPGIEEGVSHAADSFFYLNALQEGNEIIDSDKNFGQEIIYSKAKYY